MTGPLWPEPQPRRRIPEDPDGDDIGTALDARADHETDPYGWLAGLAEDRERREWT